MSNYTFLTYEQLFEEEKMLEVIKKRGTKAATTDFSIFLVNYASSCHLKGDMSLDGRTGIYWTKSEDSKYNVPYVVLANGHTDGRPLFMDLGARIALPFSSIGSIPTNGESGKRAKDGILEVEYGYYPQKAVSRDMQYRLEREFKSGNVSRTVNTYNIYYNERTNLKQYQEYEYEGKYFVRVEVNFHGNYKKTPQFSNREKYTEGNPIWIEVEPIKWLVSEKDKIMLTEKIIFSGVQFSHEKEYHTEDFDKTDIKKFIDDYWSKDIEQVRGKRRKRRN